MLMPSAREEQQREMAQGDVDVTEGAVSSSETSLEIASPLSMRSSMASSSSSSTTLATVRKSGPVRYCMREPRESALWPDPAETS